MSASTRQKLEWPAWQDAATTAAATALLALFWWLAVSASLEKSQTSDELPHIGAGYVYDRFGDFRMQPENGNLPQRLFGLPALLDKARFPLEEPLWQSSAHWVLSWEFLYGQNNLTDWLVLAARALNALLGVALGGLVFGLARSWHGRAGGLLALAFYVLAPNFLAHAALATSDLAATLFLTVAPWLFWWHLRRRDLLGGLLAGVAGGLAFVSKHNAVLLAPIYALLIVVDAWLARARGDAAARRAPPLLQRIGVNAALGLLQAVAAFAIVWAFYNFRFEARAPDMPELTRFAVSWDEVFRRIGASQRHVIEWALNVRLLPEAWLYGFADVLRGAAGRPAFFAGEHSLHGWWQFFPTLFLGKTTLGMLAALVITCGASLFACARADAANRRLWLERYAPLLATAAIVWLVALTSKINIGDRHILAAYPVLFVALGALASRRALLAVGLCGLSAHAWASFAIRPHYLAAFNALVGGPENAYRLVVDSSLDWGQDLPALRRWTAANRRTGEPFYLGYFGNAWPPHYGVRPTAFLNPRAYVVGPPLVRFDLRPGVYAISATVLAEAFTPYRGPWTEKHERDYRALRARFGGAGAATAATASSGSDDYARYDELRFARLCKYLQRRSPDAFAGYSILIFRLNETDLRAALQGPVVSLHRLRIP